MIGLCLCNFLEYTVETTRMNDLMYVTGTYQITHPICNKEGALLLCVVCAMYN